MPHDGGFHQWSPGPLWQWLGHSLGLQQQIHRNVEWVRSVTSSLNLKQLFSDFHDKIPTHNLALQNNVDALVERPAQPESTLALSQVVTVSGGRVAVVPATEPVTATFDATTLKGMAVFVSASEHVAPAIATIAPQVAGLASDDVVLNTLGDYVTEGQITRSDWTTVAGTSTLSPGAYYYLSANVAGQITSVAPSTPGQYVVVVGRALTSTTIDLTISQPILL